MSDHQHARQARVGIAGEVVASHIRPDGVEEITDFNVQSFSLLPDETPREITLVAADGSSLVVDGFTLRQVQRGEITFIEVPDSYSLEMLPRIIESIHMALDHLLTDRAEPDDGPPRPAVLVLVPGCKVYVGRLADEEP